jgi:DNA-directed RNA polymerase subunit RPC12/RpoP
MAAYAGDRAQKTHVFRCARCTHKVLVQQGDVIPTCPNGHTEFKRRMQRDRSS